MADRAKRARTDPSPHASVSEIVRALRNGTEDGKVAAVQEVMRLCAGLRYDRFFQLYNSGDGDQEAAAEAKIAAAGAIGPLVALWLYHGGASDEITKEMAAATLDEIVGRVDMSIAILTGALVDPGNDVFDLRNDGTRHSNERSRSSALRGAVELNAATTARMVQVKKEKVEAKKEAEVATLKLERAMECAVCQDADRAVVLFPCRHFGLCGKCTPLPGETCPFCRAVVEEAHLCLLT